MSKHSDPSIDPVRSTADELRQLREDYDRALDNLSAAQAHLRYAEDEERRVATEIHRAKDRLCSAAMLKPMPIAVLYSGRA